MVLGALERAGAERTGTSPEGDLELSFPLPDEGIGDRLRASLGAAAQAPLEFVAMVLRRIAARRRPG